jgi:type I restriction enzyme S subunit
MSTRTYKRLGDCIRLVDVRNRDLKENRLMGINIDKFFIPSVANVIGTDLSTYKIVSSNQFACNLMHVGRDEKMPIAILPEGSDPIIVSPAYLVFEIKIGQNLMPQYLMMWFRRTEFDRLAWFYTDADVRGGLDRSALLDVTLPIPSIEEQRRVVSEYEALTQRVKINNQLIAKLEDTAQTIYRKMFVDGIDEKHLPEGWRMGTIGELVESTLGGDWGKDSVSGNYATKVKCMRGADITSARIGNIKGLPTRYIIGKNLINRRLSDNDIVIEVSGGGPTQSTGRTFIMSNRFLEYHTSTFICSNFCRIIRCKRSYSQYFCSEINRLYLNNVLFRFENSSNGVKNLDLQALFKEKILIPDIRSVDAYNIRYERLNIYILNMGFENIKTIELQSLLLAKMGQKIN